MRAGARHGVIGLAAAAALTVLPASAGAADDACQNAAIRAAQGGTHLPDCRAYELVSPVKKNGNPVYSVLHARAGGAAVLYGATGAFAGAASSIFVSYAAERTAKGWVTTPLGPPTAGRNGTLFDQITPVAVSEDYSRVAIDSTYPFDPNDQGSNPPFALGIGDIYRYGGDGTLTWLTHGAQLPDTSTEPAVFGWASTDLERVIFQTRRALDPAVPDESVGHVYLRDGDELTLVSVGANGRPMPAGATLGAGEAQGGFLAEIGGAAARAVSDDGRVVVLTAPDASNVAQVHVRIEPGNPAEAQTRLVSASEVDARACGGDARFLTMSSDGATIWFACPSPLTADAPAVGAIYAYDVATGDLRVETPSATNPQLATSLTFVGSDRDAEHIYFTTIARLTPDAPEDERNLYLLTADGPRFIATSFWLTNLVRTQADVTPDGKRLAFVINEPFDPGRDTGGLDQVFLYDATADTLRCVSCRTDGAPTGGSAGFNNIVGQEFSAPSPVAPMANVSADGRQVFFSSTAALVPEDVNGVADAYVYVDGEHRLLTSGIDPAPSVFYAASEDGTDAFVLTHESLVPHDIDEGVTDLYSVRVGGGFPVAAGTEECTQDCQGPLQPASVPQVPGTFTFVGPDDEDQRATPGTVAMFDVAAIAAAQRRALASRGRATVRVRVSHAGRVRVDVRARIGRRSVAVASATRDAAEGGTVALPLRLSGRARAALRRTGALRLTVRVSYSRAKGAQRTSFVLRATARGARR